MQLFLNFALMTRSDELGVSTKASDRGMHLAAFCDAISGLRMVYHSNG